MLGGHRDGPERAAEGFPIVDLAQADWSGFAGLLLSPGVPLTHPKPHWTVDKAKASGVEILGDIELFARAVNAAPAHKRPKVAAITGSNGKSTTTAMLGHLCAKAGKDARVGGNIGVGVLGLDDMHGGAVYVLELSSYQLDLTASLKADAAVLLNISPDHLDRHGGMDGYVAAKRRVLLNQGKGDTAVIGVDDPWCQQICTEITAANHRTIRMISAQKALGRGVYALQGVLYDATGERVEEVCDLNRARSLPGRHNWQNAAAAYAAARALDGHAPSVQCGNVETAAARAFADAAASGEDAVVLLSPACASFDQFADFEERGEAFRAAVLSLAHKPAKGAVG